MSKSMLSLLVVVALVASGAFVYGNYGEGGCCGAKAEANGTLAAAGASCALASSCSGEKAESECSGASCSLEAAASACCSEGSECCAKGEKQCSSECSKEAGECSKETCSKQCGSEACAATCAAGEKECSAECAEKCADKECCGECKGEACGGKACDSAEGCPVAAAMQRLPKLTYAVADKTTECPKEAAAWAEKKDEHVHYRVGKETFHDEAEAQAALLATTEKFVANFTKPHTCPESGDLTLCGQTQECSVTAGKTAKLMKDAMAEVHFTYLVGDKECSCPNEAGKLAKESGKDKVFCVGSEKTACEKTAKLNLLRAKYQAAVEAYYRAQASASAGEAASSSS